MYDELILSAPKKPGIYKMYNAMDDLLYVGKAKSLLVRLRQYRDINRLEYHKIVMMRQVARVEWQETESESAALVLEQKLIKTMRPRYNILLKDDKMYPFLALSHGGFPGLYKFRAKITPNRDVFGPFPFVQDLNDAIKLIQKICGVRTCSDTVFNAHKKSGRPCLFYQTGQCVAPCLYDNGYRVRVQMARNILKGHIRLVVAELKRKMEKLAAKEDFEGASRVLEEIQSLQATVKIDKI